MAAITVIIHLSGATSFRHASTDTRQDVYVYMCAVGVTLPACREQTLGRCETQKAKEQPVLMPEICEISGADGRPGVLLMKLSAITPAFSAALDVIINFLVLT